MRQRGGTGLAVGALIGAYQEDDQGGLRALIPLSGRTLIEYQVRCASAAGTAPIVVIVERVPQALQDALERLRLDGIGVFPISDVQEALSRFEAGATIMLIGDGIAPPADLVARLAEEPEPVVVTVPDDEAHENFERIDAESRWGGVAVVDAHLLGSTAAMLGDWDLQSTLLRRAIQEGALRLPSEQVSAEPILVERPEDLETFQRRLLQASRGMRTDWVSRYVLPPIEELATEQLMETSVRPVWLIWAALAFTIAAGVCCLKGWLGAALVLMLLTAPLDIVATRLATLRLRPLSSRLMSRASLARPRASRSWRSPGGRRTTGRAGARWSRRLNASPSRSGANREGRLPAGRGSVALFAPKRDRRRDSVRSRGVWTAYLVGLLLYASVLFHHSARPAFGAELTGS